MDVNERFVKLTGLFPVPPGLVATDEAQDEIKIYIEGVPFIAAHAKTENKNLQDGTFDVVYVYKYFSDESTQTRSDS